MPKATDPMRVLQAAVAMLGMSDPDTTDSSHAANLRKSVRLTSQMATAICTHHRVRSGLEPIRPASDLSHAANFLYMLTGTRPSAIVAKAFDASLTLYAEHELNASTFTTRVIVSTQSDLHSAAAGRVAGWTANIIEQHDDNRLIRPRGDYIGPGRRAWMPLDKR